LGASNPPRPSSPLITIKDINQHNLGLIRDYVSPADSQVLWQALVMDPYQDASNSRLIVGTSREAAANLISHMEEALASKPPPRLIERLEDALRYKYLCTTADDRIALVLRDPRVGDDVFFAREATCPFVLRPTAKEERYHTIKKVLKGPVLLPVCGQCLCA